MEDRKAREQNDSREAAITEAVKELSESLIATNEAMGRLLYMLGYMKWKMPEADTRPGEGASPRPLGTDDIPHKPEVAQSVSVGPDDYEAVKHVTVKDAVRQILEKSVFQIPEDSISFRKGDGQCIEFRLTWYDSSPGVISRSTEEFSVCADNGIDGMVKEFDEHVAGLSVMHFHLKSGERGLWDSL